MDSGSEGVARRLVELVGQLLGPEVSLPEPFPTDRQLNELGVTSLKMVNLMLSVELAFDLMIPPADITPENFFSIDSIVALVGRLQASA